MFNQLLKKYDEFLKLNKKIVIIILLLILISLAWWTTSQGAKSTVPCQMGEVPVQMVYLNEQPVTTFFKADLSSTGAIPGFTTFVPAVTEHLAVRLAQKKLCMKNVESRERSLLQFVHLPINSLPNTSVPPLEAQSLGVCRITSPWLDGVVNKF